MLRKIAHYLVILFLTFILFFITEIPLMIKAGSVSIFGEGHTDTGGIQTTSIISRSRNPVNISSPWHIQTLDGTGGGATSLVLDAFDWPHISYATTQTLNYAHWTGQTWQIQIVDNGEKDTIRDTSLRLDTNAVPHIGYLQGNQIKYAVWENNR